jgi:putative hydrolase of the HAD superfamily
VQLYRSASLGEVRISGEVAVSTLRFSAVLFDVGQTLVGPRDSFGGVYSDVMRGLGLDLSPVALDAAIPEVLAEMTSSIPPGLDRYAHFPGGEDEYWLRFSRKTLAKANGRPLPDELSAQALERLRGAFRRADAWRVFPDVHPTLKGLRRMGARLGVVSNWDSHLPEVLGLLELADYFEVVGVSHLEGVEKPAPAIFHRVLRRMEIGPEQALHIGDTRELDIDGARAAGVDARLIDRRENADSGTDVIRDLRQLLPLVGGGE